MTSLATPGPVRLLPTMSGEALRAQLDRIWQDINEPDLDNDNARLGLEQLFGEILVAPLDDDWEKGWLLKLKTRPYSLVYSGVAAHEEVPLSPQEAVHRIEEIARHLVHPEPVWLAAGPGDLDLSARQIDYEEDVHPHHL